MSSCSFGCGAQCRSFKSGHHARVNLYSRKGMRFILGLVLLGQCFFVPSGLASMSGSPPTVRRPMSTGRLPTQAPPSPPGSAVVPKGQIATRSDLQALQPPAEIPLDILNNAMDAAPITRSIDPSACPVKPTCHVSSSLSPSIARIMEAANGVAHQVDPNLGTASNPAHGLLKSMIDKRIGLLVELCLGVLSYDGTCKKIFRDRGNAPVDEIKKNLTQVLDDDLVDPEVREPKSHFNPGQQKLLHDAFDPVIKIQFGQNALSKTNQVAPALLEVMGKKVETLNSLSNRADASELVLKKMVVSGTSSPASITKAEQTLEKEKAIFSAAMNETIQWARGQPNGEMLAEMFQTSRFRRRVKGDSPLHPHDIQERDWKRMGDGVLEKIRKDIVKMIRYQSELGSKKDITEKIVNLDPDHARDFLCKNDVPDAAGMLALIKPRKAEAPFVDPTHEWALQKGVIQLGDPTDGYFKNLVLTGQYQRASWHLAERSKQAHETSQRSFEEMAAHKAALIAHQAEVKRTQEEMEKYVDKSKGLLGKQVYKDKIADFAQQLRTSIDQRELAKKRLAESEAVAKRNATLAKELKDKSKAIDAHLQSEVEKALRAGPDHFKVETLGTGISKPEKITLKNGITAVFKPITNSEFVYDPQKKNNRSDLDSPHGEVAAYLLDRAMDLHSVPMTFETQLPTEHGLRKGTAQIWVTHASDPTQHSDVWKLAEYKEGHLGMRPLSSDIFHGLLGNTDNHNGNTLHFNDIHDWHKGIIHIDNAKAFNFNAMGGDAFELLLKNVRRNLGVPRESLAQEKKEALAQLHDLETKIKTFKDQKVFHDRPDVNHCQAVLLKMRIQCYRGLLQETPPHEDHCQGYRNAVKGYEPSLLDPASQENERVISLDEMKWPAVCHETTL